MTRLGSVERDRSLAGGVPIDRRGFTALGGAVAALALAGAAPARSEPARGGHMRIAVSDGASTDSLDPATITNSYMDFVTRNTRSSLIEILADGSLEPELATSWEGSDGARRWVFDLVKGGTFHSGKTLTAHDVVATLDYHRGADSKSGADWNESQFASEAFDKLLSSARSELDPAKRTEMYQEMQRIVSDEGNSIVPFFQNHVFATREAVKHCAMSAAAPLDGNRGLERWWMG